MLFLTQGAFPSVSYFSQPWAAGTAVNPDSTGEETEAQGQNNSPKAVWGAS